MTLNEITAILRKCLRFLLITHKEPDADGVGAMLAMGKALQNSGKEVVCLTEKPLADPLNLLAGSEVVIQELEDNRDFDAVIVLDCGDIHRVGAPAGAMEGRHPIINIDHHESQDFFGDLNLVDAKSSSTGELVYRVIKAAGFHIDTDMAENIFAAIQADTGSFRYNNTTGASLKIAGEMMDHGADAHQIFQKMMVETTYSRMKLLEMALGAVEFYCNGRLGMVALSSDMFEKANATWEDSENFVDYLRFVSGVEVAVLVRETDDHSHKFSMRSNHRVNVAKLAALFGGGGHARAAGFECKESFVHLKKDFLAEVGRLLGDRSN